MKNVLKNIFRKTKKEIDSSELDNTAQENLFRQGITGCRYGSLAYTYK